VGKGRLLDRLYTRPSEVVETFQYFYALDAAGARTVGLQS
jgi:hypothetical protein